MSPQPNPAHSPVLIVSYVWIGDFVRCHSVVRLLRAQAPERPVDILSSTLCAPLADYMPGVRKAIVWDMPRGAIALGRQRELGRRLRAEHYGQALMMLRTWKSALAPTLAGIPVRTGWAGEMRFGLVNDIRFGERKLPRMIDRMGALAFPNGASLPNEWPLPEIKVPREEIERWRGSANLADEKRPIVTLSPGAVGAGKAWPVECYAQLAKMLTDDGASIWVLGGPNESALASQIAASASNVRNLTGGDLRNAIIALSDADVSVTNDSGLMHVSAAIGTPTVAIFGPTSPWHQKPLNPLAAILEPPGDDAAKERARTEGNDAVAHRRTADVPVEAVLAAVRQAMKR